MGFRQQHDIAVGDGITERLGDLPGIRQCSDHSPEQGTESTAPAEQGKKVPAEQTGIGVHQGGCGQRTHDQAEQRPGYSARQHLPERAPVAAEVRAGRQVFGAEYAHPFSTYPLPDQLLAGAFGLGTVGKNARYLVAIDSHGDSPGYGCNLQSGFQPTPGGCPASVRKRTKRCRWGGRPGPGRSVRRRSYRYFAGEWAGCMRGSAPTRRPSVAIVCLPIPRNDARAG
ncbi:hypothetical protein D3C76_924410 [compost metagenome]